LPRRSLQTTDLFGSRRRTLPAFEMSDTQEQETFDSLLSRLASAKLIIKSDIS
jgi:hypothetical protein